MTYAPLLIPGTLDTTGPRRDRGPAWKPPLGGHGSHGLLGPVCHLLRRHVLHMRRDRPHVAERIRDCSEAVAPELVGDLLGDRRALVDGRLHYGVDVLDVHEDARGRGAELLGRLRLG